MTLDNLIDLFSRADAFGGIDTLADTFWSLFSSEGGDNNLV